MRALLPPVLMAALLACGDKDDGDSASAAQPDGASGSTDGADGGADGADGAGDGSADGTDGAGGTDPDDPVVVSADAWCYQHSTGDTAWLWVVSATFNDPQGLDTINPLFEDGVTVLQGGSTVARYGMTCTDAGACSASFNEAADGVSCASATTYTLEVRVVDEDGNWSAPLALTGRQGSGPSGR